MHSLTLNGFTVFVPHIKSIWVKWHLNRCQSLSLGWLASVVLHLFVVGEGVVCSTPWDGLQGSRIENDLLKTWPLVMYQKKKKKVLFFLLLGAKLLGKNSILWWESRWEIGEIDTIVNHSYTLPFVRNASHVPIAKRFQSTILSLCLKHHLHFLIIFPMTQKYFCCCLQLRSCYGHYRSLQKKV